MESDATPIAEARSPFGATWGSLAEALQTTLARVRGDSGPPLGRARVEVQLGLAHANFGLLRLPDTDARTLSFEAQKTYVQAWVRSMLHLEPTTQLVRWQVQADGKRMLVSCISGEIFETLQAFCSDHQMIFASCVPAALAVASERRERSPATVVWTEGLESRREGRVQMLRFDDQGLSATWRGWIPASPTISGDEELQAAARRFQASQGEEAAAGVRHLHWPDCMQAAGAR